VASKKSPAVYAAYNDQPNAVAPNDFWGQVRRSVRGKAVDENQIRMIVDAVLAGLALEPDDVVLDLCCGNGALADRVFARCRGGLGVDFAENQIAVAHKNFERPPDRQYVVGDVVDFAASTKDTARFTKALCYGSYAYLPPDDAGALLGHVRRRFPNVKRFFIGNLPDKASIRMFFDAADYVPGMEAEHDSPIGMWRSEDDVRALADATGWQAAFHRMPPEFFNGWYRYDVTLTPA
jgi:SAM-dependent methyltransferase